jgi:aspartyl-tRNA synthetase
MEFDEHYHEVLEVIEGLFVFLFNELNKRFSKEIEIVRKQYPVEEFKLPKDGKVLRLNFAEGIQLLKDSGEEISEFDDMK